MIMIMMGKFIRHKRVNLHIFGQDLYQYMSKNTGEEPTWDGMGNVLDPLFCQVRRVSTNYRFWTLQLFFALTT